MMLDLVQLSAPMFAMVPMLFVGYFIHKTHMADRERRDREEMERCRIKLALATHEPPKTPSTASLPAGLAWSCPFCEGSTSYRGEPCGPCRRWVSPPMPLTRDAPVEATGPKLWRDEADRLRMFDPATGRSEFISGAVATVNAPTKVDLVTEYEKFIATPGLPPPGVSYFEWMKAKETRS